MRKLLIPGLTFALAVAAAGVTQAVLGETGRSRAAAPTAGPLDPARAADRQLLAFGEAHPDCPLWTNWEKLCSRTGPGGSTYCNVDPDRRVAPSTPFCAAGFEGSPERRRGDELVSSERFCTRRETLYGQSARGEEPPVIICTRHDRERPFNGRRLAALLHPWCRAWSDASTGRLVCRMGAGHARGVPSCERLAASHYVHPRPLDCSAWAPTACADPYPAPSRPPPGDIVDVGVVPNRDSGPVQGVMCRN